jgi:hypothetical protein
MNDDKSQLARVRAEAQFRKPEEQRERAEEVRSELAVATSIRDNNTARLQASRLARDVELAEKAEVRPAGKLGLTQKRT